MNSKNDSRKDSSLLNYVFILAKGRSGTTWLANIMNTYEHCSYKNEPFPENKPAPYRSWLNELESGDAQELRRRFDSICHRCYLNVDWQPYPGKSFLPKNSQFLHLFRGLGKRISTLRFLYEWYGYLDLTEQTPVLIKDVTFGMPPRNFQIPRICEVLQPHLIVIIRNPFANIASILKGKEMGIFGNIHRDDFNFVISLMHNMMDHPVGKHLSKYRDRLTDMSIAQLEAVRWRMQVESLVEYARTYDRGLVVVYEDLCADPHGKTAEIFDFVGWELGQSTRDFINASTSGEQPSSLASKSFYSVYRDPRQSLSKWKKQLTPEQIVDIASVVCESPLIDLWSDLPI